jgi:pimeloyl-ACP methyl ester carboxylesterase
MYMPLLGPNQQHGYPTSHEWFTQWEKKGDRPIRYFIEPVILTINYALEELGYDEVYLMGKSGGGWTTTVAAAADPRIKVSFPIAGSVPLGIKTGAYYASDKGDYEQLPQPHAMKGQWYLDSCNYTCQ